MANPIAGTLYLFLHGLFVVSERGNDLLIVLPRVSGHIHRAGNWLGESAIDPRAEFRLSGVSSGAQTFSQTDFTIRLPGTSLTDRKRAATLWVPRPREILGLLLSEDSRFVAKTKGSSVQTFKKLATVAVLVYDYADENRVMLDGHYWQACPAWTTVAGAATPHGSISLHVISTSEEPESQAHENETERVLHQVIKDYPGLDFQANPRPVPATWVDPTGYSNQLQTPLIQLDFKGEYIVESATGNFAFAQAELEHPTLRKARLERLGRLKRGRLSIESLWRDPDPLSERTSNCVPITTN